MDDKDTELGPNPGTKAQLPNVHNRTVPHPITHPHLCSVCSARLVLLPVLLMGFGGWQIGAFNATQPLACCFGHTHVPTWSRPLGVWGIQGLWAGLDPPAPLCPPN